MGNQSRRQHPGEDRGRAGAFPRAHALHVSECVRLGLGAVGGRHVPVSRPPEQGAPLHSPAARRRPHQRLPGAIPLHQLAPEGPRTGVPDALQRPRPTCGSGAKAASSMTMEESDNFANNLLVLAVMPIGLLLGTTFVRIGYEWIGRRYFGEMFPRRPVKMRIIMA